MIELSAMRMCLILDVGRNFFSLNCERGIDSRLRQISRSSSFKAGRKSVDWVFKWLRSIHLWVSPWKSWWQRLRSSYMTELSTDACPGHYYDSGAIEAYWVIELLSEFELLNGWVRYIMFEQRGKRCDAIVSYGITCNRRQERFVQW